VISFTSHTISMDIQHYHDTQSPEDRAICDLLYAQLSKGLPEAENKVWHGHPVWFLDGNPIVGYSKHKAGLRLMFWSGADFDEPNLNKRGEKFKDASIFYTSPQDIDTDQLQRWLE